LEAQLCSMQLSPSRRTQSHPGRETETETMYKRLKPDGGAPEATVETETETETETCPNDDPHCDGPDAEELCCFECYLSR
jgi:hypothetical protein